MKNGMMRKKIDSVSFFKTLIRRAYIIEFKGDKTTWLSTKFTRSRALEPRHIIEDIPFIGNSHCVVTKTGNKRIIDIWL